MRIKGGGPDIAPKWFRVLDGSVVSAVGFAALCCFYVQPWLAALAGLGWFIGNAPSIGEEIGAIGGVRGNWVKNRDSWVGSKVFKWVKSDRLWGWLSGCLRGAFFGACLAAPLLDPWFILAGATFPLVYFIGVSINQIITNKVRASWYIAEWFYGMVIGICFLL